MKDLLLRYPEELRLHKYAVVEKLRERVGDDVRLVRDTLYQLFKSVILPGCKEDNQELLISLMMAYIFNAMTHLAIDVRLMAFKFLELAIQYHPPSFFLNAEKILQSFEDILWRNQFFLEDKGKLKTAFAGLELCLSLLPCNKREVGSCEKADPFFFLIRRWRNILEKMAIDGRIKKAHERLKVEGLDTLHCYYAHGEEDQKFQQCSYWMLEEERRKARYIKEAEAA